MFPEGLKESVIKLSIIFVVEDRESFQQDSSEQVENNEDGEEEEGEEVEN